MSAAANRGTAKAKAPVMSRGFLEIKKHSQGANIYD